jgi:hypothetical protein
MLSTGFPSIASAIYMNRFLFSLTAGTVLGIQMGAAQEIRTHWQIVDQAIGQGEPIFLRLTVENKGSETLRADLVEDQVEFGMAGRSGLSVTVTAPDGKLHSPIPPVQRSGLSLRALLEVKPNEASTFTFILNNYHDFSRPGEYAIRVSLISQAELGGRVYVLDGMEGRITVGPRDEAALRRRLEALTESIMKRSADWPHALTILRSIKDPAVIPYIERMLAFSQIRSMMMRHLARFSDPQALNALLDIVSKGDPRGEARGALSVEYGDDKGILKIQDPALRARVSTVIWPNGR